MIMTMIVVAYLIAHMTVGTFIARATYRRRVEELRSVPQAIAPRKPKRPKIQLNEMLHQNGPGKKCSLHDRGSACSCKYRDDWIKLKNNWIDYNEWNKEYKHANVEREVDTAEMWGIVPFWPLFLINEFIKSGAKDIPDYRQIEKMERQLRELEK